MNIGILTLPFNANYGGILQAYALQTVLQQMGHDVRHINRLPHYALNPLLRPIAYTKRFAERILFGHNKPINLEAFQNARVQNTNVFIENHIRLADINHLRHTDFDAIVVGSDQVWRCGYWSNPTTPFLQFANEWPIYRVAYAASFGLDTWQYTDNQTHLCAELLAHFNQVSVREESAIDLCRKHLRRDAILMPDPTLLLRREDYLKLIPDAHEGSPTLFAYILGKNDDVLLSNIARQFGLSLETIVADDSSNQSARPPLETWLKGISNAKLVVTNSFHGCVLASIFGKPFIVIAHQKGGVGRISSLLNSLGLEEKILCSYTEDYSSFIHDAGQTDVQQHIASLRQQGLEFLSQIKHI